MQLLDDRVKQIRLFLIQIIFFGLILSPSYGASAPIAIVDIDDLSIESLGRWPWTRDVHGRLIEKLNQYGVRAVVFDILFSELDERYPEKDAQFLAEIKHYRNVFLASAVNFSLRSGNILNLKAMERFQLKYPKGVKAEIRDGTGGLFPVPDFSAAAKGVGLTNVFGENENVVPGESGRIEVSPRGQGVVRQFPMVLFLGEHLYPSLPLIVALDLLNIPIHQVRVEPGEFIQIGSMRLPIDMEGDMDLSFDQPFTKYKHYSYVEVLKKNKGNRFQMLKDHVVIISYNATGLADYKVTPVSNYFPGSELIATAIDNILNYKNIVQLRRNQK
ncbi:MAG: CHASE2 domain-containing protein [Nitrospinota bacterium]